MARPLYVPEHINLETSDRCTRRCAFCPTQRDSDKTAPVRFIASVLVRRVLDDLRSVAWHFRGGPSPPPSPLALAPSLIGENDRRPHLKISLQWIDEPLVNPLLEQTAQEVRAALPFARLLLQTNGDLLDAERARRLSAVFDAVVVNAYARSAHQRLRDLELDVVWARPQPGAPHLSPGRLKRPLGIDDDRRAEAVWHINEKFHDDAWVWRSRPQPRTARCTHLFTEVAIAHNGDVHICCRDSEKAHPVGTIADDGLLGAYNSAVAVALRDEMQRGRRDRIAMCAGCDGRFQSPITPIRVLGQTGRAPRRPTPGLHYGRYPYWAARALAVARGDVCLSGIAPRRYEYVAGLTHRLAARLLTAIEQVCGAALRGIFIVGGRVMPRAHLRLLDPTVFVDGGVGGTLTVGEKGLLREHGPDAHVSSDLDVKVLVAAGAFDSASRTLAERALGRRFARGASIPLSGHKDDPIIRLIDVDPSCHGDAAFHDANAKRPNALGKGLLSLAYTQRLTLDQDAREPVLSCLADPREAEPDMVAAALSCAADPWADDIDINDGTALVAGHGEGDERLCGHQLIGALLDAPGFLPRGKLTPVARFALAAAAQLRALLIEPLVAGHSTLKRQLPIVT